MLIFYELKGAAMSKILLNSKTIIYPTALFLIGAHVDEKPNFMALAWGSTANNEPPMFSIAISHRHHTLKGIRQNMAFSVNIPSTVMAKQTDYCGLVSGKNVDKVAEGELNIVYGRNAHVPLLEQCPLNLVCAVSKIVELPDHSLIIGDVEESYISDDCLSDGEPNVEKINSLVLMTTMRQYYSLGAFCGKAFDIGKSIKR
jgi:flavin reductase (DIM6/NTAB) family NADH-FMN oxidoreductase RutF